MDYIKLAQRTISMFSSMIESGECHTTRSREMKDNALNGLEQLRIHGVIGRSEQLFCSMAGKGFCPYEYENGKCKLEGKCTNHTTK